MRVLEQGESEAVSRLMKAQQRVADLCTELNAVKRQIQIATDEHTQVRRWDVCPLMLYWCPLTL